MKTSSPVLLVAAVSLMFACGTETTGNGGNTTPAPTAEPPVEAPPAPATPVTGTCPKAEETPEKFGEKIAAKDRALTPLADVAKDPKAYEDKTLLMSAVVRQSCTKRGCWMEIRPEDDRAGVSMTVRFLDYGFFVPLNSRGASVTLDGTVNITKLSKADVAHLEEEGASFPNKNPDGTVEQIEITATGVEMCGRDRSKK